MKTFVFLGFSGSGKTTASINLSQKKENSLLILADVYKPCEYKSLNLHSNYITLKKINDFENVDVSKFDNIIIDTYGLPLYYKKIIEFEKSIEEKFGECEFIFTFNNEKIKNRFYRMQQFDYFHAKYSSICLTNVENGIHEETLKFLKDKKISYLSFKNDIIEYKNQS